MNKTIPIGLKILILLWLVASIYGYYFFASQPLILVTSSGGMGGAGGSAVAIMTGEHVKIEGVNAFDIKGGAGGAGGSSNVSVTQQVVLEKKNVLGEIASLVSIILASIVNGLTVYDRICKKLRQSGVKK